MNKFIVVLLALIASASYAEIYRHVDEDGNVVYSDQPSKNSEQLILPELPTYTPDNDGSDFKLTEPEDEVDVAPPISYQLTVTQPEPNQSFYDDSGTVNVSVDLTPPLDSAKNHGIIFTLDGHTSSDIQTQTEYSFTGVERGSHILVVSIVDRAGHTLKKSKSLLFHLHKHAIGQ
jgi:hypothetical protein